MSDTREASYSYIDRVIWAVVVIAIIGIGALIYQACQRNSSRDEYIEGQFFEPHQSKTKLDPQIYANPIQRAAK